MGAWFDKLTRSGFVIALDFALALVYSRAIARDGRFPLPVVPAKAGTSVRNILGSRFRRNDG